MTQETKRLIRGYIKITQILNEEKFIKINFMEGLGFNKHNDFIKEQDKRVNEFLNEIKRGIKMLNLIKELYGLQMQFGGYNTDIPFDRSFNSHRELFELGL